VTPERRDEGGIPRSRRTAVAPPGGASREEHWPGANAEKVEKLLLRNLKRQAGAQGLQLRHSAYGYALIDSARKQITDRNDMTLAEVESLLERG
jgi:hypothetical protein